MKYSTLILLFAIFSFLSCSDEETKPVNSDLTGNEIVYSLHQGSQFPISGTVTFSEKKDGTALIDVVLSGTAGEVLHPVHLHFGDITLPDAALAALLNPVTGKTGKSTTHLTMLADESLITYEDLKNFAGSVKIHLAASGPDQNVILAGGNIGCLDTKGTAGGRLSIAVCSSN